MNDLQELLYKSKEPKVFHMTENRDHQDYFKPVLEIIRHEGEGILIGPYEDITGIRGPVWKIEFIGSNEDPKEDFLWRVNKIQMDYKDLIRHISENMCNG